MVCVARKVTAALPRDTVDLHLHSVLTVQMEPVAMVTLEMESVKTALTAAPMMGSVFHVRR